MHATATQTLTPDDLLAMPDGKGFELVDGELVELNVSTLSSWVGGRTYRVLANHIEAHALGLIWPADNALRCFPGEPGKVRRPDVCFVGRDRSSPDLLAEGFLRVVPDLVVEVISTNDLARDLERKVEEYLDAGVRLVWVVDPDTRTVRIHRGDGSAARLRQDDDLSGEAVVPGFSCRVRDLFPSASPAVTASRPPEA